MIDPRALIHYMLLLFRKIIYYCKLLMEEQEATTKLLANKPAERDDAAEVSGAEVRNKLDMASSYTMI